MPGHRHPGESRDPEVPEKPGFRIKSGMTEKHRRIVYRQPRRREFSPFKHFWIPAFAGTGSADEPFSTAC